MEKNMQARLRDVLSFIENSRRFETIPGVELCRRALADLGNPEKGLKIIHVAGTNGKGSVSAFLQGILMEAGYKTGLFTSPHLLHFSERIQVNGETIPEKDLLSIAEFVVDRDFGVRLTMFDYALLIALLYFKRQRCDYVVLETGLGGRLDSTNAVEAPALCVVTHIGYDHTEILGDTLAKIAAEKAGILKDGVPAVFGRQEKEAYAVLAETAQKKGVPYTSVEMDALRDVRWEPGRGGYDFTYFGKPYRISMPAKYQVENALTAIEAARVLQKQEITGNAICRGIQNTVWAGRMQVLEKEPFLLIDGAHNPDGVQALVQSLRLQYPGEQFLFWMAVLSDKDYEEMVRIVLPLAKEFLTVAPESARALQAEELARRIRAYGKKATVFQSVAEAAGQVKKMAAAGLETGGRGGAQPQKTVAFGSLYFIGEILKVWEEGKPTP